MTYKPTARSLPVISHLSRHTMRLFALTALLSASFALAAPLPASGALEARQGFGGSNGGGAGWKRNFGGSNGGGAGWRRDADADDVARRNFGGSNGGGAGWKSV